MRLSPSFSVSPLVIGITLGSLHTGSLQIGSAGMAPVVAQALMGQEFTAQEFDFTAPAGIPMQPADPPPQSLTPASPIAPASDLPSLGELPTPPSLPTYSFDQQSSTPDPNVGFQPAPGIPDQSVGRPAEQTAYTYVRPSGLTPGIPQTTVERGELPRGTLLPLTVYREIIFPPFQAISGQLEIASPVLDRYGQTVIPAGSVVWGTFEPVYEDQDTTRETGEDPNFSRRVIGSRFLANRITINQATYLLQGQSDFMPTGFDPQADLGTVALRGAGYGAAGGLAFGLLTGGVGFIPMVAGSLAGAAAGTTNIDRVITLRPNYVLSVGLTDDLILQ
jgi:hypothetical protein